MHHLARSRFIVMKKLSLGGHSAFQGVRNRPFLPRHGSLGPLGSRLGNYRSASVDLVSRKIVRAEAGALVDLI